jgi:hypothetical protein
MRILDFKYDRSEWEYLWLKSVRDIDLSHHCAKCLIGEYIKYESVRELENITHYLCGVYKGWNYNKNLHVAFTFQKDSIMTVQEKNVVLVVENAIRIDIKPLQKNEINSPEGNRKEFYSCRNWQFANQLKILVLTCQQ